MSLLPPKERTIVTPASGWKENTYYLVAVSFNVNNPIHHAILFTGFLNGPDGSPGNYHMLTEPTWDENHKLADMHYCKALQILGDEQRFEAQVDSLIETHEIIEKEGMPGVASRPLVHMPYPSEMVDQIFTAMDGTEWGADVQATIDEVLSDNGYHTREPDEVEEGE